MIRLESLRRLVPLLVLGLVVLATGLPALAETIDGTDGNDVLTGTARNDRMFGWEGNDRLFGLGGNDLLSGGPGRDLLVGGPGNDRIGARDQTRDTINCGAGRDRVIADYLDRARANCEVVLRSPRPVPAPEPPRPPLPPTPPPAPPVPPVAPVDAGSYRGQTNTGDFVFFDVLPQRAVRGWRVNNNQNQCDQSGFFIYGPIDLGARVLPIDTSGRFQFSLSYATTITWDENQDQSPASASLRIAGQIQGSSASGTLLTTWEFVRDGRQYRCSSGDKRWTATRAP